MIAFGEFAKFREFLQNFKFNHRFNLWNAIIFDLPDVIEELYICNMAYRRLIVGIA